MPYIIILLLAIFSVQAYSIPGNFSLLAPVDNSVTTSTSPVFTWSNSAGATQYIIWLSSINKNFSTSFPNEWIAVPVYTTNYTFNFNLQENATYWWKVHAIDNTDYLASAVFACYIDNVQEPPYEFTLTEPNELEIIRKLRPTFKWNISIDPDPFDIVKYG